ncbi:hypothetical protein BHM03_00038670 [Ensete ventricosum]|nr:hypothetical protein BHM03_00038670 [Ensete ventricosum]
MVGNGLGFRGPLLSYDNRIWTYPSLQFLYLFSKTIDLGIHGGDNPANVVDLIDQGHIVMLTLQSEGLDDVVVLTVHFGLSTAQLPHRFRPCSRNRRFIHWTGRSLALSSPGL